jgi:hypothetical protein
MHYNQRELHAPVPDISKSLILILRSVGSIGYRGKCMNKEQEGTKVIDNGLE